VQRVEGRRHPLPGKINFALHLDDIRQSSMAGLREAAALLSSLSAQMVDDKELSEADSVEQKPQTWVKTIEKELQVFEKEFEELGKILDELRGMVRDDYD
jgi:hypothetical protein